MRSSAGKRRSERFKIMKFDFGPRLEIQSLRDHAPSVLISFALLLAGAVTVRPDPKHTGFYELEDAQSVYYFFRVGAGPHIFLLAAWSKMLPPVSGFDLAVAAHP